MHARIVLSITAVLLSMSLCRAADFEPGGLTSDHIKPIKAEAEENGYTLVRVEDVEGDNVAGLLAPVQVFEILRPDMAEISLARLGTSCSCITLNAKKRFFQKGERALVELHNVRPTPKTGQRYSIYVQVAGKDNTLLRLDTFVKSEVAKADTTSQAMEPLGTKSLALCIGVDKYPNLPELRVSVNDAEAVDAAMSIIPFIKF